MKLQNIIQSALMRRGFRIARHYSLLPLLQKHGITKVIDVGAAVGQFRNSLRMDGWTGPIDSYEPIPWRFEELRDSSGPNDKAWNVALSSSERDAMFYVSHNSDASSLLLVDRPKMRLTVRTQRLDVLCDQSCRYFLKVDAEGHDMDVISGASGLMRRIPVIQFESRPKTLCSDLVKMQSLGYNPQRISEFWAESEMAFDVVVTS